MAAFLRWFEAAKLLQILFFLYIFHSTAQILSGVDIINQHYTHPKSKMRDQMNTNLKPAMLWPEPLFVTMNLQVKAKNCARSNSWALVNPCTHETGTMKIKPMRSRCWIGVSQRVQTHKLNWGKTKFTTLNTGRLRKYSDYLKKITYQLYL